MKGMAVFLGVVAGLAFLLEGPVAATTPEQAARVVVTLGTLEKGKFNFVTSAKVPRFRDQVRFTVTGITLATGNQLSFELIANNTTPLGDFATGSVLTLDTRGKASGVLGTFRRCRVSYNAARQRLIFIASKGMAERLPVTLAAGNGSLRFIQALTVRVIVNGVPFDYPAAFEIRMSNRPAGPFTQRGKLVK